MTKIKLCGLTREEDIAAANELLPDFVGFVFAKKSRRCLTPARAEALRAALDPRVRAVGVFVDAEVQEAAALLNGGVIDLAQLHGDEDEAYIARLRALGGKPVIRAVRLRGREDVKRAEKSAADLLLFDSGAGSGTAFDWSLLALVRRPYLLAGGLDASRVREALRALSPYGVDVSSGIETNGLKDAEKMRAFVAAVRKEESK